MLPKHATRLARQDDLHVLMNVTHHTPLDLPRLDRMHCLHTLAFLHSTHVALGVTNMDFIVLSQAARLGERLAARLAGVRFLPRMSLHVPSQAAGFGEGLAACAQSGCQIVRTPCYNHHMYTYDFWG